MGTNNASAWETIGAGCKVWLLSLAVAVFLPFLLLALTIYSLFGGKVDGAAVEKAKADLRNTPSNPWGPRS